ncbi:MAG: preprotein translocase subunit SecF [Candidatus Aenigmatarchaeota archaeon]
MFRDEDKAWKIFAIIPVAVLLICAAFLLSNLFTTGEMIARDVELSGGKQLTAQVETSLSPASIESSLNSLGFTDIKVKMLSGLKTTLLIEMKENVDDVALLDAAKSVDGLNVVGDVNIRSISPMLGELFFQQAQLAIIFAFIFMAIIVFVIFKTLVPSLAVILCAATDMVFALTMMSLLGVELSLSLLAGLLLLIGYSVDTDVLLTARLLKHEGTSVLGRIKSATRTGVTMTSTTLVALLALYFVSGNTVLQQISMVLMAGLLIDIPATWLTNAGILRTYMARKEKRRMS